MTDTIDNERAVIGGNQPPEPTPLELHTDAIGDLYLEAKNWLDGSKIENQQQADEVTRLRDMVKKTSKSADTQRAIEKNPHDDAGKAVQAVWKPLIDKAAKIEQAASGALSKWLIAEQARKRIEADALAKIAREAEEKARAEHQAAAQTGNLDAMEAAEEELDNAAFLGREAKSADRYKPQAKVEGMGRAAGLTTVYDVSLANADDAAQQLARYFWQTDKQNVIDFYLDLARKAASRSGMAIPGCVVTPRQVLR